MKAMGRDIDLTEFENNTPQETLKWAIDRFYPRIALASSFGPEDNVLMHMIKKIQPELKIFFLDTSFHFKETIELKERLRNEGKLNIVEYTPEISIEEQEKKYGERLFEKDPDLCCKIRKVEPLERALKGLDAWITGLRREQAPTRKGIGIVERDRRGLYKINPLARWTYKDVWDYIMSNNIPYNPLHDRGYPSIGCKPCTRPVKHGEDQRAGRWSAKGKTECGIHL